MNIAVVIPAYNEQETIAGCIAGAWQAGARHVIVANDGSTDDTADIARQFGATVVDVPRSRRGMTDVYRTGILHALSHTGAEIIVEMDAGGSHRPADLRPLAGAVQRGVDVAASTRFGLGGRYEGHWQRKLLSRVGTAVFNLRHGTGWTDATGGYIAYSRLAAQLIFSSPFRSTGHYYQCEVRERIRTLKLTTLEVPIVYRNSGSSLNWKSIREAAKLVTR